MIHFVGAGPGAPDLITVRGADLLRRADAVVYTGSLINPALLDLCREDCALYNSAERTLEEVLAILEREERGKRTENQSVQTPPERIIVRLHTGDPSLYGTIREQMAGLQARGIPYDVTPGVSSFLGAAASMGIAYTVPGGSQTVILSRMEGRTPSPERLEDLACHRGGLVLFLSAGLADRVQGALLRGGYPPDTPAAIVYRATWPEERIVRCTVEGLAAAARQSGIGRSALILVGDFLGTPAGRSRLYDPAFSTGFRTAEGREAEL